MKAEEIEHQLSELAGREQRLGKRIAQLEQQLEKCKRERRILATQRDRLELCRLIGQQVTLKPMLGRRLDARIAGQPGELIAVNRKNAVVRYATDDRTWNIPIDWLQPADAQWMEHGAILFMK